MSAELKLPEWVGPLLKRFYPACYRIVWSEDITETFFGETKRKYGDGRDRWILERWELPCPRSQWTPEDQAAFGAYPENGTWEWAFTFEIVVNDGEPSRFMPLMEDFVELVLRALVAGKLRHTEAERKAALEERQAARDREYKRRFDDLWDDSAPAPGAKIPDHIQRMDSFGVKTAADVQAQAKLPKKGFAQIGTVNADSK